MKRILYIGIYKEGSTSKLRADQIRAILSDWEMSVIDTDIPKENMCRIWQAIGFRYKKGPLIGRVNNYVLDNLGNRFYDLIWVDKAIYLTFKTTQELRAHSNKLVHYTPDTAFFCNFSSLFNSSMSLYDFVITTKSFEIGNYIKIMGDANKVLYVTQGFDKELHRPIVNWEDKRGVAFIGRFEKNRARIVELMLKNSIDVNLAGPEWENFVASHNSKYLHYWGKKALGNDYVKIISGSLYAWGAISKLFPEKHTTRTFEIPACKTALLTERNPEIEGFFTDDEVIYYNDTEDLIGKIKYYNSHLKEFKNLVEKGYSKVQTGGYDYESIIRMLLKNMDVI